MKKTIQVLALVLAIGATVQTIRAYASETGFFSVEVEEHKMTKLIELRKEVATNGDTIPFSYMGLSEEFPQITNHEQLNEEMISQKISSFIDVLFRISFSGMYSLSDISW